MPAIAGIVYPNAFQASHLIDQMVDTMSHRGKKYQQAYSYKNIELLTCGSSYISNEKKTIIAGIDGSIYGLDNLQAELKKHGYHIKTNDTAEFIVHAYELWEDDFIQQIRGDFALFIFDKRQEKIIIARDRIGNKPLYWYHGQNRFMFASEIKGLLASGLIPQSIATESIASYLYFGFIPQDMSPIKNVNKLLPGYTLHYNLNGTMQITPYWSLSSYFKNPIKQNNETILENINTLLLSSVKERIPKDKPMGCLVSGGLGSASVAHLVKEVSGDKKLSAYTVGFKEENDADTYAAKNAMNALGIPHYTDLITADNFMDDYVKIAWHLDDPLGDPNVIATWKGAELASQNVQYVFSGMGSDELLAGHTRYSYEEQAVTLFARMLEPFKSQLRKILIPLFNAFHQPTAFDLLKQNRTDLWQYEYLKQNSLFGDHYLLEASPSLAKIFDPEIFLHKFEGMIGMESPISAFLYFDIKTRMVDCFISQFERLTSAHSLIWNTPFLDQRVIEYLVSIPEDDKIDESQTAIFLKTIVQNVFPENFLNRPKKTRRDFLKKWALHPELYQLFTLLRKGTLIETGLISEKWLVRNTQTPEKASKVFKLLWAILALETWFCLFINRPVSNAPPDIPLVDLLTES